MVRLRLISFALAAVICVTVVYLAITHKFSAVTDLFTDTAAVKVVIEEKKPPPPPPPPPPNTPPPPPPPVQTVPPPVMALPQVATEDPVQQTAAPPPAVLTGVTWLRRPGAREFSQYYPSRASERNQEGHVTLRCVVDAAGHIACTVQSEDPPGWGFGDAAIRISRYFQMAPRTADGRPTSGGTITVPITFNLAG